MHKLNIQLFADVTNKTTSASAGNNLSAENKTFYDKELIKMAGPNLVYSQFAQKRNIPKNGGKTIEFRKFKPLAKATTPLTEGVTPDGQALDVTSMTATVGQYGGFVRITDLLDLTAIDPIMTETVDLIGDQAGRHGRPARSAFDHRLEGAAYDKNPGRRVYGEGRDMLIV